MDKKLLAWFDEIFGVVNSYNDSYFYAKCPSCGKPRFYYNTHSKKVKCWKCFDEQNIYTFAKFYGYEIDLSDVEIRQLSTFSKQKAQFEFTDKDILPKNAIPLYKAPETHQVVSYLKKRGLPKYVFDYLKLYAYYTPPFEYRHVDGQDYSGRILFPLFDASGRIRSFTGRAYDGAALKHKVSSNFIKGQDIWNREALYINETVFVTEGIFDAGFFTNRGVALNGIAINDYIVKLFRSSPVYNFVFIADQGVQSKTTFLEYWRRKLTSAFANTDKNLYIASVGQPTKENGLIVNFKSGKTDINDEFKRQGTLTFLKQSLKSAQKIKTQKLKIEL